VQGARRVHAAELGGQLEPPPLGIVEVGGEGLLEAVRHGDRMVLRVEDRRVAVGILERVREDARGQPVHLVEHAARRVGVELGERAGAQYVLAVEHLEEVELEVPEVALVVPHRRLTLCFLLVSNIDYSTRW
jgi:hypothetical protein